MTKYENKIIKLFDNRQYLNKNDIYDLLQLLINYKELNNYVDTITFEKSKSNNLAMFLVNKKKLLINYEGMSYLFNNWYRNLGLPLDSNIMREFYNLYGIIIVLHEINHVSQVKKSKINKDDSETIILQEGIELGSRSPSNLTYREKLLYKYAYWYIPVEKNAEITALFKLIDLNQQNEIFSNEALSTLNYELINHLLKGYNLRKNVCPTETYYTLRGKKQEFHNIPFNEDYSNFTKLSLGMPINDEVIHDIKLVKKTKEYKKLYKILK